MLSQEICPEPLEGKRVIITGGTTGAGRAMAMLFARQGCRVFICGRDASHLRDALHAIREEGGSASGVPADLSSTAGILGFYEAADAWLGAPDIVVLNVGIASHGELDSMGHEECRQVVEVNLLSYISGALEAMKRMKKNGGGHLVMTGSMSAEIYDERASVYVATKSAVRGFAASLRKEANDAGIRVSLIEPGTIGSDMVDESPERQRQMQADGLMLLAEDIARVVAFIVTQPQRCDVISLQVKPIHQLI